jgi:hypothetical protein
MRKYRALIAVAVVAPVLTFALGSWTVGKASGGNDVNSQSGILAALAFPKTQPFHEMKMNIAPMADGTANVYSFVGQDLDTNATILFLTNTTDETATVTLYKYYLKNNMINVDSVPVELGPGNMIPICSDEVVSNVGIWLYAAHWDLGPNFLYGIVILPPGVAVEGYIAWNGSDNTYDPGDRNDNNVTVPLQFTYVGTLGQ